MDWISWASRISGGLIGLIILSVVGFLILDYFRNRNEPEIGADEAWADPDTGELGKIVKEVSYDRDSEPTGEIDMEELHTRLALEDVQIAFNKGSAAIVDSIINTLNDDKAWTAYIESRKAQKS